MTLILSVFEQGMIYAVMALGVYITYKILDFPDLTVGWQLPSRSCHRSHAHRQRRQSGSRHLPRLLPQELSSESFTGVIHVKFKVRDLLSGIIMMTALYTINLRIAGGQTFRSTTRQLFSTTTWWTVSFRGRSLRTKRLSSSSSSL